MAINEIKTEDRKGWMQRSRSCVKAILDRHADLHVLLCEGLKHAHDHGDAFYLDYLYLRCIGEDATAIRNMTIKDWLFRNSGQQLVIKVNSVGDKIMTLKKGWTKEKFTLDKAEKTPFWSRAERPPASFSFDDMIKSIKSYERKLKTAVENETFTGDEGAVSQVIVDMVKFLEQRKRKLTDKQLGLLPVEEKPEVMPTSLQAADETGQVRKEDAEVHTEEEVELPQVVNE